MHVLASTAQTAMQQPDQQIGVLWADEIVVADSGSTDRTAEIVESLGARDSRPCVVRTAPPSSRTSGRGGHA
jgi:glycosyltransferase involved in cell wall biosynthesis